MNKNSGIVAAVCVVAGLAGCGGGGGGGGAAATVVTTSPSAVFPVQSATAAKVNNGLSATVSCSGTVSGVALTGTLTVSVAPATSATFQGQAALANADTVNGTLSGNGTSVPFSTTQTLFTNPANYQSLGSAGNGFFDVQTTASALGATVQLGNSGSDGVSTNYTDSTLATQTGTDTSSWSVLPDTSATTAILQFVDVSRDTTGAQTGSTTTSYRISTAGAITLTGLTLASGSGMLTCKAP